MKLGVNSVLYGGFDFATAAKHIALAGYDGVEISAIKGMCEHLELDRWKAQATELKEIVDANGLEFLSMEVASLDEERLLHAFEAGAEIGIPVINVGPGGKSGSEEDYQQQIAKLRSMAEKAEAYGVTLCVKAHLGQVIDNTTMTLRALEDIQSPAFGIDMDPSHIFRAGEEPEKELLPVLKRMKHIHIRDCRGRQSGPGEPANQACGRGDIQLYDYCKALVQGNYNGPVCLEVIGANKLDLPAVQTIAAESYGYLNATFQALYRQTAKV
ncbi:sugar phosphate isomerase/epimerase family protein [Aureibacillus halotolerans]|uniref:Sugar phosphate isomerase/epimerase n=1 Tax=Aureibacillus halotolerans TaxID=1508390 RepID=A0A4R6U4W5_9BACI|nr:sugar phosphate isomerase/epimerase family protein [Aureibacillus halotolerans]TDQ40766.1 sugar phosphate isomerase/epimerase [Aureibacillus halotolerans]